MIDMKKILFVCTGNTCRSPMAMALFNKMAEDKGLNWQADSAGLAAYADPINLNAVKALAKIGIDFNDYTSKRLNFELIDGSNIIAVMTDSHKAALISVGVDENKIIVLGGGIPDPFGGDEDVYSDCLESIKQGIEQLIFKGVIV